MKRIALTIGALLFSLVMRAQSVTYTCRYWFDQDHAQAVATTFNESTWQAELDVGSLSNGLHTLFLQICDTSLVWDAPKNYLFYKASSNQTNLTYHYWFDNDSTYRQSGDLDNGNLLLDVETLSEGVHLLHMMLKGDALSVSQSYMFYRVAPQQETSDIVYHYWFDQDTTSVLSNILGNGNILMNVAELENGLHTVNIALQRNQNLCSTVSSIFMKVQAIQADSLDLSHLVYHCWFDNDYSTIQTGSVGAGIIELEVGDLSNGIHTVNFQLDNGSPSAPECYLFYKRPVGGMIAKWEYWLNGEINNRFSSNLSPCVDTLSIITLLPVETQPIRSSCFHFHPNGDEPYINAKNEITLRFWNADNHFIDKTALYIDENVSATIVADALQRNTTVTMDAPRDNQIHWYKLGVGRGDYVSFQADKACTMQLFTPSGEEVFSASGAESILMNGFNVWEDGTYYLAVHDVTSSGETVSLTYNWLNRYTIVSYDVHLVGNGGCSSITFQGNGFNSLLDAYLVNWQNDTIRSLDIGHESNTKTTVSLNFYQENLGVYDAVFQFYDETIRINGAMEVQEPVDIVLTSTVSYPSAFLRNTPCTYTYTITNNGNMSAYAVPIYVYIASSTKESISRLKLEGLELPSIIDGIDLDSLAVNDRTLLQEWADEIGDNHYFFKSYTVNEETGDSVYVRSNFFFLNLAPFESKVIAIKTFSDEPISVFVTVPDDIVAPLTLIQNRSFRDQYCCIQDKITCWLDLTCNAIDFINSITSAAPGTPVATIISIANCACGIASNINTATSALLCEGDSYSNGFWAGIWDMLSTVTTANSIIGSITKCLSSFIPGNPGKIMKVVNDIMEKINNASLPISGANSIINCYNAYDKPKPNCPPGVPQGGQSTPVNSFDPNDIRGYLSESGSHHMRQEIQNVQYEIEFENDTTLATAAAHTIIVRDTLDASKFDLNSLAARSVTISDKRLELDGEQTFARTLDMRPELYVIAQIEQDYDPATGIIEWTIQSLDPMTMEPTDDPNQGVLPVNYNGNGVGFIDYSINLKEPFADGTEISNRAGIIFDQENQILTPTWTNIVDAIKPISHIEEVNVLADMLNFTFMSDDNRSGVWYHTLYFRNASTEQEWKVKKAQIFENSYLYTLDDLMTTEFLVMAVDSAGNHEEKEMVAEYTYYYEGPGQVTQNNAMAQGWNWWSTYIEQNDVDGLASFENILGHNGLTIKSQNAFVDNYYQYMDYDYWYGSLEEINNEQGYVVNVTGNCDVSLEGVAALPVNHPISIQPNWNWIGYPVSTPQTVTAAMGNFTPSGDDVVKSQTDYAFYYEGYGWFPDDFMFVPGEGYKYNSNAAGNKTLTYVNGSRGGLGNRPAQHYWESDSHRYADNLNVTTVVVIDSVEQRNKRLELGAFVNGVCRGSAPLRYFAPLDRYYAMLTVSGMEGERITFGYIDSESGQCDMLADNNIVFEPDAVIGKPDRPFKVCFGTMGQNSSEQVSLHPNPVKKNQEFLLNILSNEKLVEVTITDMLGTVIRRESGSIGSSQKGLPVKGVYVIEAVAESGTVYRGKLIVE